MPFIVSRKARKGLMGGVPPMRFVIFKPVCKGMAMASEKGCGALVPGMNNDGLLKVTDCDPTLKNIRSRLHQRTDHTDVRQFKFSFHTSFVLNWSVPLLTDDSNNADLPLPSIFF